MRTFHLKRGTSFCPTVNIDRLWSMVPEDVYEKAKAGSELTPVLDVTKLVYNVISLLLCRPFDQLSFGRVTLKCWVKESCHKFPLLSKQDISVKM